MIYLYRFNPFTRYWEIVECIPELEHQSVIYVSADKKVVQHKIKQLWHTQELEKVA